MELRTCRPLPIADFRHVLAVFGDVSLVFDKLVADGLFYKGSAGTKLWNTVNSIGNEMEPVKAIHHHLIEGRAGGAFFLVAMHMKIPMIGATIGEPVNQRRIAVIGEDDRLIYCEELIEFSIAQTMRVVIL